MFLIICGFLFIFINLMLRLIGHLLVDQQHINNKPSQEQDIVDVMMECPTCHVYFPKKHAVAYKGKLFCCSQHASVC
jgi:formylmethanofuran dehydrogenase subunit E